MMSLIDVLHLGKKYFIGSQHPAHGTLRDTLADIARKRLRLLSRNDLSSSRQTIWALNDVSFRVGPGEAIGVIGRNGAGKSTLLKILSRVTEPTIGRAVLRGRVGSLLEVGTGFHPELSGRENIYLNAALLGMRRIEVQRKFQEIVAFSEVEMFLDTPVKFYSSGMHMRLAFSVAAHLNTEILLVDEVLAVGDMAFQRKCLGKINDIAKTGRTVLFVSHNMVAVQKLCRRVILLERGQVTHDGNAADVIAGYSRNNRAQLSERIWSDGSEAPGNDVVRIRRALVHAVRESDSLSTSMNVHTPLDVEFEYSILQSGLYLNLSVIVCNDDDLPIFNTGSGYDSDWRDQPFQKGVFRSTFRIPGDFLNDGLHRLHLMIVRDQARIIYQIENLLVFDVQDSTRDRGAWYGKWVGAVRPRLPWKTELVTPQLFMNDDAFCNSEKFGQAPP